MWRHRCDVIVILRIVTSFQKFIPYKLNNMKPTIFKDLKFDEFFAYLNQCNFKILIKVIFDNSVIQTCDKIFSFEFCFCYQMSHQNLVSLIFLGWHQTCKWHESIQDKRILYTVYRIENKLSHLNPDLSPELFSTII